MAMPTNYARALLVYANENNHVHVAALYYELGAAPAGDLQVFTQSFANAIHDEFEAALQAILTDEAEFAGVQLTVNVGGVAYSASSNNGAVAGTINTTDELPNNVAVVIQKRTAQPGKSGRGRFYIGCVPESFVDSNAVDPAAQALYNTFAEHVNATIVVSGISCAPRHHSKKLNALYPIVQLKVVRYVGRRDKRSFRPIFT